MLDDLMGNLGNKQAEIQAKLKEIQVEAEVGEGAITAKCNGAGEVLSIQFDQSKMDTTDTDQLEDYLLIVLNDVLKKAKEQEASVSGSLIKDMLPPGFGNIFGN